MPAATIPPHAFWFGEDQARYVVSVPADRADALIDAAGKAGIIVAQLGMTGGDALILPKEETILLKDLLAAHENWMPDYMSDAA
jgi:hypothetical protein